MNDTQLFIAILIIHWSADFILQTHHQATTKSKSNIALLSHTISYSVVWIIYLFIVMTNISFVTILLFGLITFISHTATDYVTSRQTARLYEKQDFHNFFVVIGFDQVLHYLQLWFTYKLLF